MINHLEDLEKLIEKYEISPQDVCLITSCSYAVHGIRKNDDIEFALKPEARKMLLEKYGTELEYNSYSREIRFSEILSCRHNQYIMFDIDDDKLFSDSCSETVQPYKVVNLDIYVAVKILQNSRRDQDDIDLVKTSSFWTPEFESKVKALLSKACANGWEILDTDIKNSWTQLFSQNLPVYIFGTGYVGKNIYKKVKTDEYTDKLAGFLVSEKKNDSLNGVKIFNLVEIKEKKECIVIVAVATKDMKVDMELLRTAGFTNLINGFQYHDKG
jgi:hypothetical protein